MPYGIVVPVDLNQESALPEVFRHVKKLTEANGGSRVDLITVVPELDAGVFPYVTSEQIRTLVDAAQARPEEIGHEQLGTAVEWQASAVIGRIARTIMDIARDSGADLIVMASHDPVLSDLLFGSVAAQVVKHAECSVLVVRPHGKAASTAGDEADEVQAA